jgi:hypothetical protein
VETPSLHRDEEEPNSTALLAFGEADVPCRIFGALGDSHTADGLNGGAELRLSLLRALLDFALDELLERPKPLSCFVVKGLLAQDAAGSVSEHRERLAGKGELL